MRSLTLSLSLLTIQLFVGFGCASSATIANAESPKGPVELTLDAKHNTARLVLEDSKYKVQLKEISDSRCPANAKCIWAGELAAKLEVDLDKPGSKESKTFTLGETTAPSTKILGASWDLVSITETSVTIRATAE